MVEPTEDLEAAKYGAKSVPKQPNAARNHRRLQGIGRKMTKIKAAPKKGRPRLEEASQSLKATKPWVKLDMSRATWFRRQLEQRKLKEK